MELTHFGHACILVETPSARLLFDPGTLSDGFEQVEGVDAVLITHQHADHLDLERLLALLAGNPDAVLVVDEGSVPSLDTVGLVARAQVARPGESLRLGGELVSVTGGSHAVIHPDLPAVANNAYVVGDGAFYHPGDSLVAPSSVIDVLAAPLSGPWLRVADAVDFVRAVSPRVAVPIHEQVLARPDGTYGLLASLAPAGTSITVLPRGEAARV